MGIKNLFSITKNTFKDFSFLWVLNWVTIHSQTEKCEEIISTRRDWKVKHARIFQIVFEVCVCVCWGVGGGGGGVDISSLMSSGFENLSRSDFDHLNLFQS